MPREQQLTEAFVELADTLVDDFDVIDFLGTLTRRCLDLLGSTAVGIMLADLDGQLRVAAASSEAARLVELFELQNNEGPCLDAYRSAAIVSEPDLSTAVRRWPRFGPQAVGCGFQSVHAVPLRLRDEVIGVLNLFGPAPDPMTIDGLRLGQALADVATIGILHERAIHKAEVLAEQLQSALHSRVVIEQAKGVLAERGRVDMETAFLALRGHARRNRLRLGILAKQVVDGTVDAAVLLQSAATSASRPAPDRTRGRS